MAWGVPECEASMYLATAKGDIELARALFLSNDKSFIDS